jgi:hypothetical protein
MGGTLLSTPVDADKSASTLALGNHQKELSVAGWMEATEMWESGSVDRDTLQKEARVITDMGWRTCWPWQSS